MVILIAVALTLPARGATTNSSRWLSTRSIRHQRKDPVASGWEANSVRIGGVRKAWVPNDTIELTKEHGESFDFRILRVVARVAARIQQYDQRQLKDYPRVFGRGRFIHKGQEKQPEQTLERQHLKREYRER